MLGISSYIWYKWYLVYLSWNVWYICYIWYILYTMVWYVWYMMKSGISGSTNQILVYDDITSAWLVALSSQGRSRPRKERQSRTKMSWMVIITIMIIMIIDIVIIMVIMVTTNCDDNLGPVVHEDDVPNIKESVTTQDPNKRLRDPLPECWWWSPRYPDITPEPKVQFSKQLVVFRVPAGLLLLAQRLPRLLCLLRVLRQ